MGRLILICFLALAGTAASAETVYIRDTLYVPLRGGAGQEYRILDSGIRSGTALELIREDEETGWSQVRTGDGLEGWLQTQYLVDEPIAADLLDATREQLLELEAEHQRSLLRVQKLLDENAVLAEALESVQADYRQTATELEELRALSAETIAIVEQNEALVEERETLDNQIDALLEANDQLQDDQAQEWFLRGGVVTLIALVLGFWFARRIYLRRANMWD